MFPPSTSTTPHTTPAPSASPVTPIQSDTVTQLYNAPGPSTFPSTTPTPTALPVETPIETNMDTQSCIGTEDNTEDELKFTQMLLQL